MPFKPALNCSLKSLPESVNYRWLGNYNLRNNFQNVCIILLKAVGGLDALTGLFGKRSVEQDRLFESLFQNFGPIIDSVIMPAGTKIY